MRRLTSGRRRQDFARAQNDIQTVSVARIKRHEKHIQRVSKKTDALFTGTKNELILITVVRKILKTVT